jgi:hypothetical protein
MDSLDRRIADVVTYYYAAVGERREALPQAVRSGRASALPGSTYEQKRALVRHAPSVAAKRVSIWSLRRETFEPPQRLLTIEVDNARKQIVQARGVCNQMAGYTEQHRPVYRRRGPRRRVRR